MEQRITALNGVNIYYYMQPNTHSICLSLYIKAGTLYEDTAPGITHFLEHLHFRRLGGRTQKELYYQLESIGGYLGACTYKEFLRFYLTASPQYFSQLVKIASDLLGDLEADMKDFAAEKRLILSEIREDNQYNDIDFISGKYIWKGTNLENPVLGTASSLKSLTLQALKEEKEKIFTKNNMFFYISGNFENQDVLRLKKEVERFNLDSRPANENNNMAKVPENFKNRNAFVKLSNRKYMMHDIKMSFDIDFSKVSRRELLYLDSILADGLCSLLRAEIIEKRGLIYSFSSSIEQYSNIGMYSFTFQVHKSKLYEAVKGFISVLNSVKKEISEKDMQTTRVFKTDNQMTLLDDPDDLNWTFAYENHILNNDYSDISALADANRGISAEHLLKIANEIFLTDNVMLIGIGNKKGLSERKLREILLKL